MLKTQSKPTKFDTPAKDVYFSIMMDKSIFKWNRWRNFLADYTCPSIVRFFQKTAIFLQLHICKQKPHLSMQTNTSFHFEV